MQRRAPVEKKIVLSPALSTMTQNRYVIVDAAGNVIDDANGYGYFSWKRAYRAMKWKERIK